MRVETKEPITIELKQDLNCVIALVDGVDYAIFCDYTLETLSVDLVREWIEETYYDNSYLSPMYSAPYITGPSFRNDTEDMPEQYSVFN